MNDKNTNPDLNAVISPEKTAFDDERKLSRRGLWSFAALTSAAVSAIKCSSGDKASFRGANKEKSGGTSDQTPEELPPVAIETPIANATPTPIPGAEEGNLNQDQNQFLLCEKQRVDVRTLNDLANPSDRAKVVIYGRENHAMIVVDLPTRLQNNTDQLKSISIHRETGHFIAQYMLTSADIRTMSLYWPFVFKNMRIKFGEALYLRYTFTESLEFKQKVEGVDVAPLTTYEGKLVKPSMEVDILGSATGRSAPEFAALVPVVNFAENDSTGIPPTQNPVYNFSSARQLRTAQTSARFLPAQGLAGYVITDLSGNLLAADGGTFIDIMNYPNFICYKPVPNLTSVSYWVRTIVSTG